MARASSIFLLKRKDLRDEKHKYRYDVVPVDILKAALHKTGKPKRRALEMGGKLINIVKYTSTYQSKALLLLFRMVITGAMIDDHIVVVFTLE